MERFVSFDLETTGTLSYKDDIIEVGAILFEEGKVKDQFQTLVSIEGSIPAEASQVNGITDEMLKNKPSIEEVLPLFSEFCGDSLIVAHNAPFDFQFLLRVIQEHRVIAPKGLVLDTCQLARKTFFRLANYKLSTLCSYLKIEGNSFHRAESDAYYCGQLFLAILKKQSLSVNNIKELIELSGRSPLKFPNDHLHLQMGLFD
ncbi:MAG: 3'-5' exonuclease [Bdellovibrionales bacterium]|nr:3'-5' exonuclease [Bdellovibrionales bacterium]